MSIKKYVFITMICEIIFIRVWVGIWGGWPIKSYEPLHEHLAGFAVMWIVLGFFKLMCGFKSGFMSLLLAFPLFASATAFKLDGSGWGWLVTLISFTYAGGYIYYICKED